MARLVCLLALFLLAVDAKPNPDIYRDGVDARILGGRDVTRGDWAWTLSLQKLGLSWSHACGAVLITNTFAITSCHCVTSSVASNLRVAAGLYQQSNTANVQYFGVQNFKMHELYNTGTGTYEHDIALLHLAQQVTPGPGIQIATLADGSNNFADTEGIIVGWGRISADGPMADIFQQATIKILTTTTCNSFASQTSITDNHICAYDNNGLAGACVGDGGGPLHATGNVVAGIGSFIIPADCSPNFPSIYTRVGNYIQWIVDNISRMN